MADHRDTTSEAEIDQLSGSSPPRGAAPACEPIAGSEGEASEDDAARLADRLGADTHLPGQQRLHRLAERTRRDYARILDTLRAAFGGIGIREPTVKGTRGEVENT